MLLIIFSRKAIALFLFLSLISKLSFSANQLILTKDHITDIPLADLMNVTISTVSRKDEKLQQTAAAVFVISQDDIRRSSANSIPELLRMAPGISVARIDANKWSVTSRGFSGRFADDLLVMIDGRTVYSPLFAGTFWETLDLPLEDIERIEVIRGPSGTIWGANAANGAIHIITKTAKNTQGKLITAGGGTEERGFGTARYGGQIGDNLHYRVYGKGVIRDNSFSPVGANDDWRIGTAGFRADWDINPGNEITFLGQYYSGKAGQNVTFVNPASPETALTGIEDVNFSGGHALMRWKNTTNESTNTILQIYYDHTKRNELSFRELRHTVDVDFQQRFPLSTFIRQDIIWGGGYRWSIDHLGKNLPIFFDSSRRNLKTANVFIQSEMSLIENLLTFTPGLKYLDHTYTNGHLLPSARVLFTPGDNHSLWFSAIRSVRLPSRFEREGNQFIQNGAEFIRLISNPLIAAETLWSFETGYKHQFNPSLSVDIAGFYNDYDHSSSELELTSTTMQLTSDRETRIYGFEIFGEWRAMNDLRFMPTYSYLQVENRVPEGQEAESGQDPIHQFTLRAQFDLAHNIDVDAFFRHIHRLPGIEVDSYQALDLRLAWRPVSKMEISVIGQNLLQTHHQEFAPELIQTMPVQIQRGIFTKLTWRF
ncbi:MAG: TonB-dependent receptor [Burkholderiales bacterium]|nr:TonB-dependent receptor [Nitrosomonas sp.]MCP5275049.1 TonB-dependent receptor [Burkholderiales bacterium]